MIQTNLFQIALTDLGLRELPGDADHPRILAYLQQVQAWPAHDEVGWCSAAVGAWARVLRLPYPRGEFPLLARSWLEVGEPVALEDARCGFDVVVLKQADADPGADVLKFRGHVGVFVGWDRHAGEVYCLGGNQSNAVTIARYPASRVLGVRRLG